MPDIRDVASEKSSSCSPVWVVVVENLAARCGAHVYSGLLTRHIPPRKVDRSPSGAVSRRSGTWPRNQCPFCRRRRCGDRPAARHRPKFAFPQGVTDIVTTTLNKTGESYPVIFRDLFKYLSRIEDRGAKPNYVVQLVGRFVSTHSSAQRNLEKSGVRTVNKARVDNGGEFREDIYNRQNSQLLACRQLIMNKILSRHLLAKACQAMHGPRFV